ncbi:MAG: hypothetical protein QXT33_06460 [Thermofilum sp.]
MKVGKLARALPLVIGVAFFAYASLGCSDGLRAYAGYWALSSPLKPADDRHGSPVVIVSVRELGESVKVTLLRTYSLPGLLDSTVDAKLYLEDGAVSVTRVKVRQPLGTLQELWFLGGGHPIKCTEVSVRVDGVEAARWSTCQG